jgi:hypothetical protein
VSSVTIIFRDSVDIWFARQLVNERVKTAETDIPEGYGKPELSPVATALGDIYEFVLTSEKHTPMELRTYMDWEMSRKLKSIPGVIDIGKWYRNTDTMFYMKDGVSSFKINEGDIYGYVRFHTEEEINFIQYRHTDTLNNYMMDSVYSKENKKRTYPLTKYYSMFKSKNLVLEEIKRNILGEQ